LLHDACSRETKSELKKKFRGTGRHPQKDSASSLSFFEFSRGQSYGGHFPTPFIFGANLRPLAPTHPRGSRLEIHFPPRVGAPRLRDCKLSEWRSLHDGNLGSIGWRRGGTNIRHARSSVMPQKLVYMVGMFPSPASNGQHEVSSNSTSSSSSWPSTAYFCPKTHGP
jgi:hypothetical protein